MTEDDVFSADVVALAERIQDFLGDEPARTANFALIYVLASYIERSGELRLSGGPGKFEKFIDRILRFCGRYMLMLSMPADFKVGETRDCRINGKPTRVTWYDQHTLVIGDDDVRQIFSAETDGRLRCFMCGDARREAGEHMARPRRHRR
jgi:hypothetical protein